MTTEEDGCGTFGCSWAMLVLGLAIVGTIGDWTMRETVRMAVFGTIALCAGQLLIDTYKGVRRKWRIRRDT